MKTAAQWFLILAVAGLNGYGGVGYSQQKQDAAEIARWQSLAPQIQRALPPNSCPGQKLQIRIVNAADLGGDDGSVALVDYCPGGVYTSWIVPMRLQGGRPVLAQIRRDGKPIEVDFLIGSSVMHSNDVHLLPIEKAIHDLKCEFKESDSIWSCLVNAYVWNPRSKTFDWDAAHSKRLTQPDVPERY